jgi:replicative superfamily II helicase
MVDFSKKLTAKSLELKVNPSEIYDTLDRASDKGPLRPAQLEILDKWYKEYKDEKDVIIKLHTGQGKTLVGLLILQSKLNQGKGPAIYLCSNIYLVKQTCEQARQFGIKYCEIDRNRQIPLEFHESKAILITHVQKLFTGHSTFGLHNESLPIDSIILDDSHACIETIQDAFTIKINQDQKGYKEIFELFENDLEEQGAAKLEEIKKHEYSALLPVPYWAWKDKYKEVVSVLVKYKDENHITFSWDLIKDSIKDCHCIISGNSIEILPYKNPIEQFGSFFLAKHRVFMSATTNNDVFFIKGLGLAINTIEKPLVYESEKWSGEKMILIPYLINDNLTKAEIVNRFTSSTTRNFGVVALTPSDKMAEYWEECGAIKVTSENIEAQIELLKQGNYEHTRVFSNRYDGIDLPDKSCRILIIDSKPHAQRLFDILQETCRHESEIIAIRTAQKIEQGLGRGVRGEKDYCVIIITGESLINTIKNKKLKKYFSPQTRKQIDIGFDVARFAIEESVSSDGMPVLVGLINQCLKRDDGWKAYYVKEMNNMEKPTARKNLLEILTLERRAEELYAQGNYNKAAASIQTIIDSHIEKNNNTEIGWYLQEMARISYSDSKVESNRLQVSAHSLNRYLMKPREGMTFKKLTINKARIENLRDWIEQFDNFDELKTYIAEILSGLDFGIKAEIFESSLCELGKALGFGSERPDKEWKRGPDNLWNVSNGRYILLEAKSEVKKNRAEINKDETGQMNNATAWFSENYSGDEVKNIMIIPTKTIASNTGFNETVAIMTESRLKKLKQNVNSFFNEFKTFDLQNLSEKQINTYISAHTLLVENLLKEYSEKPYQKK